MDTWIVFAIAIINAFTAWMTWRTHQTSVETQSIAKQTELNTNSLAIKLNEQTALASHAAGREEMRVEADKTAADLVKSLSEK